VTEERARATQERAQCEEALAAAAEELQQRVGLEEETRRAVAAARQQLEQADRAARELREQARRLEIDREAAEREQDEVAQRRGALDDELTALADRLETVRRESTAAEEAVELAREMVAQAQFELETARAAVRTARDQEAGARAELARADEARASLQGKINGLEALERDHVGLAPAAARLLKERQAFGPGAVLGPLADFITAASDAAAQVERYLGASVHAMVVRDRAAAEAVRAWHARQNLGPLLLLPADAVAGGATAAADGLATRVSSGEPAERWVRALLGGVEVVGDGTAFVDARGAVFLPGHTTGPGPLRRRAELAELREQLEAVDARRAEALRTAEQARAQLSVADRAPGRRRRRDDRRTAGGAAGRRPEGELARRVQRAERELGEAQQLAGRLTQRVEELAGRARALHDRAAAALEQATAREQTRVDARAALEENEQALETAREERTVWQVEQAQAQARLQVATDRERRLAQELQTAAQRSSSCSASWPRSPRRTARSARRMAEWQLDLESRRRRCTTPRAAAPTPRGGARATPRSDAGRRSTTVRRETRGADESTPRRSHTQLAGGATRCARGSRPSGAAARRAARGTRRGGRAAARREPELRRSLEQLGVVNPLAVGSTRRRCGRASTSSLASATTLAQAKGMLQQAIREIDATARELFLATFAQARENFRQIFQTLFGGGECDLRLEDPTRPLDCDIEVHASPRGKKTQRIHLLSSGERALVALSLLFGIFLTKPSPFCLLDEVDAPLDDQNVGRFVRMLNQFKVKTQFIVITHNPRTTTEAADAVYGVTMQEPGVSSVVSVRLRGGPPSTTARGARATAGGRARGEREPGVEDALALAGD
jgi:chromosome segregation protein